MLIDEVPTIFITYKFRKENNEKKFFEKVLQTDIKMYVK